MNNYFGLGKELIYTGRLKRRVFYSLTIAVIVFNISIASAMNLKARMDRASSNIFLILDLHNNLKDEEKEELEKTVLSLDGVSRVQYLSKSFTFKKLQNDLNISIPEKDNPLSDSITIYMKDISYLSSLEEQLENNNKIKAVFKDENFIEMEHNKYKFYRTVCLGFLTLSLLVVALVFYIFSVGISVDFFNCINIFKSNKDNLARAKRKSLISFTIASTLGSLIFLNSYLYFRTMLLKIDSSYTILSFLEIIKSNVITIIVLNLIIWFIPSSILKLDGDE